MNDYITIKYSILGYLMFNKIILRRNAYSNFSSNWFPEKDLVFINIGNKPQIWQHWVLASLFYILLYWVNQKNGITDLIL